MFTVQMSEDEYRIVGPDGEEGCAAEYGEVATLKIDGAIYYADLDEETDAPQVFCVQTVKLMPANAEFVDFEEEEDDSGPVLVETTNTNTPEVVG